MIIPKPSTNAPNTRNAKNRRNLVSPVLSLNIANRIGIQIANEEMVCSWAGVTRRFLWVLVARSIGENLHFPFHPHSENH